MPSAVAVVACALALLGKSETTMPRIVLVDKAPVHASAATEAFVSLPDPIIYVVTSSPLFQEAQASRNECGNLLVLKKLASVLAHEEWHIKHGPDERGAYEAQLTALLLVGVPPGHSVYINVTRSMQAVLKKGHQKPVMVLAATPLILGLP